MSAIHLIERENRFTRVQGPANGYESGYWALSEATARGLVGGNIYFHERQIEPSFYGGLITAIRVHHGQEYDGRIIFRFEPRPECRGVRAGREGWQVEQKIVP